MPIDLHNVAELTKFAIREGLTSFDAPQKMVPDRDATPPTRRSRDA
jgi:hypothetical protein